MSSLCVSFLFILFFLNCSHQPHKEDWGSIVERLKAHLRSSGYPATNKTLYTKEEISFEKAQRWCLVGDTGVDSWVQRKVADELNNQNQCSRIFHLGDIIYPTGLRSENDPELKTKFLNYYAPFKVPFQLVLGNHEYYSMKVEPWLQVAEAHSQLIFPYFYYAQNLSGICVVSVDSTPMDTGSEQDPRSLTQRQWMKQILTKLKAGCAYKIFIAHHPYQSMNKKRSPSAAIIKFYEDFVVGNFDLAVAGHDHVLAYLGQKKGTEFFISGAGGKITSKKDPHFSATSTVSVGDPGFLILEIKKDKTFHISSEILYFENNASEKKTFFKRTLL